jgi:hypothetical protein
MISMKYATRFKVVNYALPLLVIGLFAKIGLSETHSLFAQTPPSAKISIILTEKQYRVGQDVEAIVSNISNDNVYIINKCPESPLTVSKLVNGEWQPIVQSTDVSKCAGEPTDFEIPADRSIGVDYKYWPNLFSQPGTYQIHASIEPATVGASVTFSIVP